MLYSNRKLSRTNLLTLRGPSPGEPSPPRIQVVTHLIVHDSAFLDLGRWILAFLQSLGDTDAHSPPDSVCGMFDRVSVSACCCCCCWGASILAPAAAEAKTAPAANKLVRVMLNLLLPLVRQPVLLLILLLLLTAPARIQDDVLVVLKTTGLGA